MGDDAASASAPKSRRKKILALIERHYGKRDAARIVEIAGARPLSLHPRAVRGPKHPFHAVLGREEAGLLCIRIVTVGLGSAPVQFSDRRRKQSFGRINSMLLEGKTTDAIVAETGVKSRTVNNARYSLRRRGLLPRPSRKPSHRKYW